MTKEEKGKYIGQCKSCVGKISEELQIIALIDIAESLTRIADNMSNKTTKPTIDNQWNECLRRFEE